MLEGLCRDVLSGQEGKLTLHFGFHGLSRRDALADKQHLAVRPVLCLTEEVGCHEAGVACLVGQHFHFAGTCGHVDGHIVEADLLLGAHHELIARAEYLIDLGDALCSVGHSADGLHAAYLVDAADASDTRGNEDGRVDATVARRRCAEHDVAAACYLGGCGKHEDGAEERGCSAGDVEADALDGDRLLPAFHAIRHLYVPALEALCLVEAVDVAVSQTDGFLQFVPDGCLCGKHLGFGHSEVGKGNLVEAFLIVADSGIASLPDILQDSRNGGIQLRGISDGSPQQFVQLNCFGILIYIHVRTVWRSLPIGETQPTFEF